MSTIGENSKNPPSGPLPSDHLPPGPLPSDPVTMAALENHTKQIMDSFKTSMAEQNKQLSSIIESLTAKTESQFAEVKQITDSLSAKTSANKLQISKLVAVSNHNRDQCNMLNCQANYQNQRKRDYSCIVKGYTPKDEDGNTVVKSDLVRECLFKDLIQPCFIDATKGTTVNGKEVKLNMNETQICSPNIIDKAHVLGSKSYAEAAEVVSAAGQSLEGDSNVHPSASPSYIICFTSRQYADLFFTLRHIIKASVAGKIHQTLRISRDLTAVNRSLMTFLHKSDLVASYPANKDGTPGNKKVKCESGLVRFCKVSAPSAFKKVNNPFTRDLDQMTAAIPSPTIYLD